MSKKSNIIKTINLDKVRKALKMAEYATKPQLAEMTDLSVVTINSLVNTLIEKGEVISADPLPSQGGRPAEAFAYNKMYQLALLVYIQESDGIDTVFYRVINSCGDTIDQAEDMTKIVRMDTLDQHIGEFVERYPQIRLIYFGIPGVEVNENLVIMDIVDIREKSLSRYMSQKYNLTVEVENDINAAVAGYAHLNRVDQSKCVIGLYYPDKYPPGAGIYMNGRVVKGRNGLAGEIKYLPFDIDWDTFSYNESDLDNLVVKTIQSLMCLYNPDSVVVYSRKTKGYSELVNKKVSSPVEKIMIPEIIESNDFNSDFETGIKELALQRMDDEEALDNPK